MLERGKCQLVLVIVKCRIIGMQRHQNLLRSRDVDAEVRLQRD